MEHQYVMFSRPQEEMLRGFNIEQKGKARMRKSIK